MAEPRLITSLRFGLNIVGCYVKMIEGDLLKDRAPRKGGSVLEQWQDMPVTRRSCEWTPEGNIYSSVWRKDPRSGLTVKITQKLTGDYDEVHPRKPDDRIADLVRRPYPDPDNPQGPHGSGD